MVYVFGTVDKWSQFKTVSSIVSKGFISFPQLIILLWNVCTYRWATQNLIHVHGEQIKLQINYCQSYICYDTETAQSNLSIKVIINNNLWSLHRKLKWTEWRQHIRSQKCIKWRKAFPVLRLSQLCSDYNMEINEVCNVESIHSFSEKIWFKQWVHVLLIV